MLPSQDILRPVYCSNFVVPRATVPNFVIGNATTSTLSRCPPPTTLANANATLTLPQLRSGLIICAPATSDKTLTTPTASAIVGNITNPEVGTCFTLNVINNGTGDGVGVIIAGGTGVSIVGLARVDNATGTDIKSSGSGTFLCRITNITASAETCVIYRVS